MNKTLLLNALIALTITGCSTPTTPSGPKPHPEKYALQIVMIEVPGDSGSGCSTTQSFAPVPGTPPEITELLENPDATISEFPVVYAGIGETATADQTKPYPLPNTYEFVYDENGDPQVAYGDEVVQMGRSVELTIYEVKTDEVSYNMKVDDRELQGVQNFDVEDKKTGKKVAMSMPIFRMKSIDTKMKQTPGAWVSMGGLAGAKKEGDEATSTYVAVRILPPQK